MPMTAHDGEDAEQRHLDALVRALGPAAFQAVADPDVTEIYVNPSGAVFFDTRSRGRVKTAEVLRADQVYRFLNLVASSHGAVLTTARPQLQAELPRASCGTLHAETALGALQRLDRLAQRNNVPPQPDLVASAIDLVVVIAGGSRGRRVTQVAEVDGHDARGFHLHAVPGC